MREILFRGKRTDTGEWVEGFYLNELWRKKHYILKWYFGSYFKVIPETVGQFTGFTDKHGKRIFEGDILKCFDGDILLVMFTRSQFILQKKNRRASTWQYVWRHEIIGNIHDNPDLLKEARK